MTTAERREPAIIDGSRRQRIATGSGVSVSEVNALLKQFGEMQKMMKGFGGMLAGGRKKKKGKKAKGSRVTPKGGNPKLQLPPDLGDGKTPFRLPGV